MYIVLLHLHLPTDTLNTLKFQKIDHSFGTRGNVIGLIKQPTICTYIPSQIFQFNQWNNLQKTFSNFCLSDLKISKLKNSGNQILSKQIR